MPYYRVRVGVTFHNEEQEPTEKDDGTLVLASGQSFAKGTWQVTELSGDKPAIPGAAVGTTTKKPERKNPARGFSEDNIADADE